MTTSPFLSIIIIEGGGCMMNAEEIGKKIAQLRKENGLTQKELAATYIAIVTSLMPLFYGNHSKNMYNKMYEAKKRITNSNPTNT